MSEARIRDLITIIKKATDKEPRVYIDDSSKCNELSCMYNRGGICYCCSDLYDSSKGKNCPDYVEEENNND